MCLACQMEADWLAYLEHLAQQELPQGPAQNPASAADGASPSKPAAQPEPASPFVCEEQPSE